MKNRTIENLNEEQKEILEMAFYWILENHVDLKKPQERRYYEIIYDMAKSMVNTLNSIVRFPPKGYHGKKMSFDDFDNIISFAMNKKKSIVNIKFHESAFILNTLNYGVSQEELKKYFK